MKKIFTRVISGMLIISMCFAGAAFAEMLPDMEMDTGMQSETVSGEMPVTEDVMESELADATLALVEDDAQDQDNEEDGIDPEDILQEENQSASAEENMEVPFEEEQITSSEEESVPQPEELFVPVIEEQIVTGIETMEITIEEIIIEEPEIVEEEIPVPEIVAEQETAIAIPEEPAVVEPVVEEPAEILLEEVIEETEEEYEVELEELNAGDNSPLSYGMTSSAVYALQKALYEKGYEIWPDGYFGVDTYTIVMVFQMYNGLTVNGIADEYTQKLAKGNGIGFYGMMRGSNSKAVAAMQSFLRELGYLNSGVDGDFGSYTEASVKAFQKTNGLYVDGVVGMKTLRTLLLYPIAASGTKGLAVKPLTKGDQGDDVVKLQNRLTQLGYPVTAIDGDYGAYTEWCVAMFQRYNNLPVTGSVDEEMIYILNSADAVSFHAVSYGDYSTAAYWIQYRLRELGYLEGIVDGYYGNYTRRSVMLFQRVNGIYMDGVASTSLITKLFTNAPAYDPSSGQGFSEVELMAMNVLDRVGWNLYSAFEWSVGMSYNLYLDIGYTTSGTAIYSYRNYYGNCISMATTFYWMARMLGYSVRTIYGSVPYRSGGSGPHGWVEIDINGGTYVCDPDFERQTGNNGYLIYYGQSGTWKYQYGYILSDY